MTYPSRKLGLRALLLSAVLAVAISFAGEPAMGAVAWCAQSRPSNAAVEIRRTATRCYVGLTRLTEAASFGGGHDLGLRCGQPAAWSRPAWTDQPILGILSHSALLDEPRTLPVQYLAHHLLNLPPPHA